MLQCLRNVPVLTGVKHIPRVNSNLWWDIGGLLHSRVRVIQHWVTSHGISITQDIKVQPSVCKITESMFWDSERVIHINFLPQLMHNITVTFFKMMWTKWFGRKELGNCQRWSSYCMTIHVHIQQIWLRKYWQQWTGKSWTIIIAALTYPQWFNLKVHLEQKFQSNDEQIHTVLNLPHSIKSIMLQRPLTFQDIGIKGDYLVIRWVFHYFYYYF
jgi:hypothetical protein